MPFLEDYITEVELAKELGIGLRTLRYWRQHQGVGPPITRVGRRLFFKRTSVQDWLDSRERPMPRQDKRRGWGERGRAHGTLETNDIKRRRTSGE